MTRHLSDSVPLRYWLEYHEFQGRAWPVSLLGRLRHALEGLPGMRPERSERVSREALSEAEELAALRPRIVPTAFFDVGLPGPRADLVFPGLALSWVLLLGDGRFRHVTDEMIARWTAAGTDWRQVALGNLRPRHPKDKARQVFTGYYDGPDGRAGCAFALHDDGLGLSRLLLREETGRLFPDGYRVALPDLQAGMVISTTAAPDLMRAFAETVERYYESGSAPLRAGLYDPAMLRPRESSDGA
jgi:hypothetical protein